MGTYATSTTLDLVMVGVNFTAANMSTLASKAIDQAESEVNKYLSKRYDLSSPTFQTSTSIPPIVRTLTEQISEGYMWRWNSRGSKESLKRGDSLIDAAKENLQAIADRKLDVVDVSGLPLTEISTGAYRVQCSTKSYTTTFDEDDETAWAVDKDKLDDISDARD